jgi:hypothetical protein
MLPVGNPMGQLKEKRNVLQGTLALIVRKLWTCSGRCTATPSLGVSSRLANPRSSQRKSRHFKSRSIEAGAVGFCRLGMGRH